jgi:plasmid stability protein
MAAITVRLDDDLHTRLKLLAIATGKSANQLIADMVAGEADRVLGAKGSHQPGEAPERLKRALGWDSLPELTDEQRAEADRKLTQAQADAERIYGNRRNDPATAA